MTDVHQCPACELRFRNKTELEFHWAEEHNLPVDTESSGAPPSRGQGRGVLSDSDVEAGLADLPGWAVQGGAAAKEYSFPTFPDAIEFVNAVAGHAEAADHHPDLDIRYNKVRVALVTHSAGGITAKDLDMAHRIEGEAGGSP